VYDSNFPDPFVLEAGGTYYAYATNNGAQNYPTLISKDLVRWEPGPDAFPQLPPWATGDAWAPEVLRRADGKYVLYFTARTTIPRSSGDNALCIGHAVADRPLGPFKPVGKRPLICQTREGGSIDASPFRDSDGKLYLLWKNDGNCCAQPTFLYSQRLSPDGLRLLGKPARLSRNDKPWEGNLVEAPQMLKHDGRYYLFYSANFYGDASYNTGYAVCKGPLGPCTDAPENPILATAGQAVGPGHPTVFRTDEGGTWILYHAWPPGQELSAYPGRVLWLDRVVWKGGKPDVQGPTEKPQPLP
jgi:beta-xylosidase